MALYLTVTDGKGKEGTNNIIPSAVLRPEYVANCAQAMPGTPPTGNAGPDREVSPGQRVTLDGRGSANPHGAWHQMAHEWQQVAGMQVALEGPNTGTPSFTATAQAAGEKLVFRLTVTVAAALPPAPEPEVILPTANAGPDQEAPSGATVTLPGASSVNPYGEPGDLAYRWAQVSGPSVTLSGDTLAEPTFAMPSAAEGAALEFLLTVTDKEGESDSDAVTVTVRDFTPPKANAGPDLTGAPGESVTLQGRGSTNPYGRWHQMAHQWTQLSGPTMTLDKPTHGDPAFTVPADASDGATLEFRLTVTDKEGEADSDTMVVTVAAPETVVVPETVRPTATAGPDLTGAPSESVTLQGKGSRNPYGRWHQMAHQWTQLSGPTVTLDKPTHGDPTFTVPADAQDGATLEFQLTVTDKEGESDSDTVTVTVDVSLPDTRVDYDVDGDNLIEVANLAQLRAIFHDLNGDGQPEPADANEFHTAYANPLPGLGCQTTCAGYELAANLDFDTNANGRADSGDAYWNDGLGWLPIGGGGVGYSGEFNGNGHTISNLYLRRRGTDYGLFGRLGGRGFIHHVGLLNVSVTNTQRAAVSGSGGGDTGAMVGEIMSGDALVAASFATGSVSGGWQTGGLVGDNEGRIVASWTNIAVSGGNKVGGIAGDNTGMVIASYAIGSVASDSAQYVHGVAGYSHGGGSVRDSYFNTNAYPSAGAGGRTAAQLQAPTDYAGIYANWNVDLNRDTGADDPWDFGGSGNYPLLKADSNGDGTAAWEEFSGQTRSAMAPTACAGPDLTGAPGGQVTLEGQCSTNPYGRWHQMAHQWTQLSGPSVTLTHPQESKQAANKFGDPRFTVPADAAGGTTLEFQLTVTDKEDQSDSDTMTITVPGAEPEPANTPPTASIDTAQVTAAVAGETVALQGVGNDAETTAESLTFAWIQVGGTPTVSIANASAATATITAAPDVTEGTELTFRLTVTDAGGLSADAETTIGVGPPPEREPNRAPTFDANIDTVLTVAENSAAGVNVGSPITTTDPDGDTPAYSLSGADVASFQIDAPRARCKPGPAWCTTTRPGRPTPWR